jgi:hypothetical protein
MVLKLPQDSAVRQQTHGLLKASDKTSWSTKSEGNDERNSPTGSFHWERMCRDPARRISEDIDDSHSTLTLPVQPLSTSSEFLPLKISAFLRRG